MAEKIQEIEAPGYKRTETDWIKNDGRGWIDTDYEKMFQNEKYLLDSKVKTQFNFFKDNLTKTLPIGNQMTSDLIFRDLPELQRTMSTSILNAPLGPAGRYQGMSVAENLRTNNVMGYKDTLISQGFDDLFKDGLTVEVDYYDENFKWTPKNQWNIEKVGSNTFITHAETGLKFQFNRNGLAFVDDGNFKINNKTYLYENILNPKVSNTPPSPKAETFTSKDFDPLEDYNGPAYDAQTMDRDIPIYEENIAKNIDKQTGTPGIGMKSLDVIGKVFGPVDEIVTYTLGKGIPKLFAGTALAGVMGGASGLLYKV